VQIGQLVEIQKGGKKRKWVKILANTSKMHFSLEQNFLSLLERSKTNI